MSSERKPIERSGPSAPNPATRVDFSADAELVLAALGRMETAIRSERVALDRLQIKLGEMAAAIAGAKSAVQSSAIKLDASTEGKAIDLAALLDELEHRVDAMLEIAGGDVPAAGANIASLPEVALTPTAAQPAPSDVAPAPVEVPSEAGEAYLLLGGDDNPFADDGSEPTSQAPESHRVPTVSGVVSRLSRSHDALAPDDDVADDLHATGAQDDDVPTVSMLEAMVEALSASAPAAAPEALAVPPLPELAPQAVDAVPQAEEPAAEVMATPEPSVPAEPEASVSVPELSIMQEIDLLTRFAQMEAFPILPPEVGTAVIFTRADEPKSEPVDMIASAATPESDDSAAPQPEPESKAVAQPPPEPPRAIEQQPESPPPFELLVTPPDLKQAAVPQAPELDDIAHQRIEPATAEPPPEPMPAVKLQDSPLAFALVAPAAEPEAVAQSAPESAQATMIEAPPAEESAAVTAAAALESASPATEADFDPAEFLFGANSEWELAGSLQQSALEPAPEPAAIAAETPPQAAPMPPRPPLDLAPSPLEPPPAEESGPPPAVAQPAELPSPVPVPAPYDPLAPLKSMSAEERIALFS